MSARKNTQWKDGESGNPRGRPRGTGRAVSRLRKTITALEELADTSVENIKKSVEGEEVDKTTLDTSKWVITTIPSLSRAATAEEQLRENVKARQEENDIRVKEAEAEIAKASGGSVSRFSTNIIPFKPSEDD